jgi:hypothetical protein
MEVRGVSAEAKRLVALVAFPVALLSWQELRDAIQYSQSHWLWLLAWGVSTAVFVRMCIPGGGRDER